MEWDHRDREPCLSPAAFVNQVQYSNILEGRFKQLQGKRHTDELILFKGKLVLYSLYFLYSANHYINLYTTVPCVQFMATQSNARLHYLGIALVVVLL